MSSGTIEIRTDSKALHDNQELLQKLYRAYSTSVASGTKWKMTLHKLLKLLKDANLLRENENCNKTLTKSLKQSANQFNSFQKRGIE